MRDNNDGISCGTMNASPLAWSQQKSMRENNLLMNDSVCDGKICVYTLKKRKLDYEGQLLVAELNNSQLYL